MPHNGGKLPVNLYEPSGYNTADLVDFAMAGQNFQARNISDAYLPAGEALKDSRGLPTAMPAGAGSYWRQGQVWVYGEIGDTVDLVYDSQHTVSLSQVGTMAFSAAVIIAPGHKRYTITSKGASTHTDGTPCFSHLVAIQITAMGSPSSFSSNIKLYRTEHQIFIDAGETWHPDLVERLGGENNGHGSIHTLRFMDCLFSNDNWARGVIDLRPVGYQGYGGTMSDVRHYAGAATKSGNVYTIGSPFPGNPVAWVDAQPVCFYMPARPTTLTVETVTVGNPTSMKVTGHGLNNGDQVGWEHSSTFPSQAVMNTWSALLDTRDTVTGLMPAPAVTVLDADNFTIPINSTGLTQPTSLKLMPTIKVTDGVLPAKRCVGTGFRNYFNSAFATYASGGLIHGRYFSDFDVIFLDGDRGANFLNARFPVEDCIDLAAKIGAHAHIVVSPYLNQAARRALLQKIKDRKPSWMKVKLEIGNEPWNNAFLYNNWLNAVGIKYHSQNSPHYGYAHQVLELADDAEFIFDSDDDFEISYNFQNIIDASTLTSRLNTLSVGTRIDVAESAPYFLPKFSGSSINASAYTGWLAAMQAYVAGDKATAFEYMKLEMISGPSEPGNTTNEQIDEHVSTYLPGHLTALAGFIGRRGLGVRHDCYEGLQHVQGPNAIDGGFPTGGVAVADIQAFWEDFLASDQYGETMTYYLEQVWSLGIRPSIYTLEAPMNLAGSWGVLSTRSYPFPETPAYVAMMAWGNDYYVEPPAQTQSRGDDAAGGHKGVRPRPYIRPKVERDLDEILTAIDEIADTDRASVNKIKLKAVIQAVRKVDPPTDYKPATNAIEKALKSLAKAANKQKISAEAKTRISLDLEMLVSELERKRKRRQRDEESIAWLLS